MKYGKSKDMKVAVKKTSTPKATKRGELQILKKVTKDFNKADKTMSKVRSEQRKNDYKIEKTSVKNRYK
jgi:hypothetical protein